MAHGLSPSILLIKFLDPSVTVIHIKKNEQPDLIKTTAVIQNPSAYASMYGFFYYSFFIVA